jgi:C4-dicarboxylate transporter, DctM subunit
VAACAVFAAVSGSSAATAATIGSVSLPAFRARRYNEPMSVGSLAAGATLGIMIPPSIAFIIYGVLVEESIGRLYMAGMIPGIMLTLIFMAIIAAMTLVRPSLAPRERAPAWRVRLIGLFALLPMVGLMFLVLGTIYMGVATPTEAAAFGVVGALVLAALEGNLNFGVLRASALGAVRSSCMIMLIITGAFTLSFALAILGVPGQVTSWVTALELTPVGLVLFLIVFYLLLGTFMESLSMMVITLPILVPILRATGVDLIWFGVIMVVLIEAALITPPQGLNLYVIHGIRKSVHAEAGRAGGTIIDLYLGVLPFVFGMLIMLGLLVMFPQLALWLPEVLRGP